jgi:hypothetical protein
MTARTPPMQDATLIEALNNATSLELYQLAALVERLLSDPRRIVAVRQALHLGQVVRFYDARHDQLRLGRIVELRDAQLTLHGTELRGEWRLPYAAIVPPEPGTAPGPTAPPPATVPKPTRADFRHRDKVLLHRPAPADACRRHHALQPEDSQRRQRRRALERALRGAQAGCGRLIGTAAGRGSPDRHLQRAPAAKGPRPPLAARRPQEVAAIQCFQGDCVLRCWSTRATEKWGWCRS